MRFTGQRFAQLMAQSKGRLTFERRLLILAELISVVALAGAVYLCLDLLGKDPAFFSPTTFFILSFVTVFIAINAILLWMMIRSRRTWAVFERHSDCDELTGALNRTSFLEVLDGEMRRAGRYRYPLSLCLLDLDEFASLNESFGRDHGNQLLQNFSRFMMGTIRFTDSFSRYGNDEFAVILPHTDIVRAQKFASRVLMQAIERIDCSFCAGLTLFRVGEERAQFLDRAVLALQDAQREGKKRIRCVIADDESRTALSL